MRLTALLFSISLPLNALTIQIDYSLDSKNFFSASGNPRGATGAAQARAALEAAAARWSSIISQPLQPVVAFDHATADIRLSFPDPSNFDACIPTDENPCTPVALPFQPYEISSATSSATDSILTPGSPLLANQYQSGGIAIPADTFIIYVGARPLTSDALTGSLIGNNHEVVINDPNSFLNRGFNSGPNGGEFSLPAWGSSISFNSNENNDANPNTLERKWHFDHTSEVPGDSKDFYSVALAEIGHALGVGLFYTDWTKFVDSNSEFIGPFALATYQIENGVAIDGLELQSPDKRYFARDFYTSKIYPGANPNYVGTVGQNDPDTPQAILFQARPAWPPPPPPASFVPGIVLGKRFEITNLDVAVIRDIGWSLVPPPSENEVPFITLTKGLGSTLTLSFPSETDASYTIQTSTNMQDWFDVTPDIDSEGTSTNWRDGEAGYTDPLGPASARSKKFYRVLKNE